MIQFWEQVFNIQSLTVWHISFLRQNEEDIWNHLRDEGKYDACSMFHQMVTVISSKDSHCGCQWRVPALAALSSQTFFSLLPLSNTLDFGSLHVPFDFYDPCVTIKIKWGSLFNLINSCRNQQGSHCMVVTTAHKWKVLLSQPEGLAVWNSWHFCEHPEFLLWQFITSLLLKWMIDNSYLWNCEMH